ncbi:DNRLRE domain-containing protein [Lysinibacillus pakistanensis]|uniref:DNRLRE domain-containing protein n=1 Tax=Lysinibacillus pakistanensis TaxID=759811 RepID=UPI003D289A4E
MSNTIDVFIEIQAHTGAAVETEITAQLSRDFAVYAEITVPEVIENTMQAKFFLYGTGRKDILVDIQSRAIRTRTIDSEIHSRALRSKDIYSAINAIYRGNSDVFVEIQPMGFVQIPAEIEVRPHTNMQAIYETKKPPILSDSYFPIQDAFTKKEAGFQTINYGKSSTMVIGNNDEFESFIKFETKRMDSRYVITNVKLELTYLGEVVDGYKINLHTAARAWYETGITYQNKPPKLDLISHDYVNDKARKVIIFDVTDIASTWLFKQAENNGLVMSTTEKNPLYFRTNNSSERYSPRLVVSYYDSVVPSTGRSQIRTEIFIYNRKDKDVRAEIEVASIFSFERILTEIYVHQPDVPLDNDIFTEITVNKAVVEAEITAIRSERLEVFTVVTARSEQFSRSIDAAITVSRKFTLTEVTARLKDKLVVDSEVYASKNKVLSEISVSLEGQDSIYSEITANDIHVRYIEAEITPRIARSSDIFVEIEPNIKSDILNEITSTRQSILSEIIAARRDDSEIFAELIVRAIDNSDTECVVFTSKDKIFTEITVNIWKDEDITVEITPRIKRESEVLANIYVNNISEVLTVLDVVGSSLIPAEITVSRQIAQAEIYVPFYENADILTEIKPRILFANDIYCEITMGKVAKGYAFIL